MTSQLAELIAEGDKALQRGDFDSAELNYAAALSNSTTVADTKDKALDGLMRLSVQFAGRQTENRPRALFDYFRTLDLKERTSWLIQLADLHLECGEMASAEKFCTEVFLLRVSGLGFNHPETTEALQKAALLAQMQGKSPEELYRSAMSMSAWTTDESTVTGPGTESSPAEERGPAATAQVADDRERVPEVESGSDETASASSQVDSSGQLASVLSAQMAAGFAHDSSGEPAGHIAAEAGADSSWQVTFRTDVSAVSTGAGLSDSIFPRGQTDEPDLVGRDIATDEEDASGSGPETAEEIDIDRPSAAVSGAPRGELPTRLVSSWSDFVRVLRARVRETGLCAVNPLRRSLYDELAGFPDATALVERSVRSMAAEAPETKALAREIDWRVVDRLMPLFESWAGDASARPYEDALVYGFHMRALKLGSLHADTITTLRRLAHYYATDPHGGRFDEGAASALRVWFWIDELTESAQNADRSQVRFNVALALMEMNKHSAAAEILSLQLSGLDASSDRENYLVTLSSLADCLERSERFEDAADAFGELCRLHQEVSHHSRELFESMANLVSNYERIGNLDKAMECHQRLLGAIDWLSEPNAARQWCAWRYEEKKQYERAEQLLNDILTNTVPSDPYAVDAVQSTIRIYEKTGRHRQAEKIRNPWYDPDKERPLPGDVSHGDDCLAWAAHALNGGNLFETREYYLRGLELSDLREETLVNLLRKLRELGIAYWHSQETDVARECLQLAVEHSERRLGLRHEETAAACHDCGVLLQGLDKSGKPYLEKAFRSRISALGPDHLDTAESAFELGRALLSHSEWGRRESSFRLAVAARQKASGLFDERTRDYLQALVDCYAEEGQFLRADRLMGTYFEPVDAKSPQTPAEFTLTASRASDFSPPEGSDPVGVMLTMLDEKKSISAAGAESEDALITLNRVLSLYKSGDSANVWSSVSAINHLSAALIFDLFGFHFLSRGDNNNAEAVLSASLKIREQVMGYGHADTALSLANLALAKARQGDLEQATRFQSRAVEILQSALGTDNLLSVATTHNLACILHRRGRLRQAEQLYGQVRVLLEQTGCQDARAWETCRRNMAIVSATQAADVKAGQAQ